MTAAPPLVGISISDAPDRARLGFPEREVDRALFSICTALVRKGWDILYAGNLDPSGYTFKMFRHLAGTYASGRETPFIHLVPEPVLRQATYPRLRESLLEGRGTSRTRVSIGDALFDVRPSGEDILISHPRGVRARLRDQHQLDDWLARFPVAEAASAFSTARQLANAETNARVALGGKMGVEGHAADRYAGAMPGVVEEAILALQTAKPLVPLAAFGGATRDVAIALGLASTEHEVPRGPQPDGYRQAINLVRSLSGQIPRTHRPTLENIVLDDRTEPLAFKVASLLELWMAHAE